MKIATSLLLVLSLIMFSLGALAPTPGLSPGTPMDEPTNAKLGSLTVSVHWDHIDVADALRDLEKKTKLADPSGKGLRFKLELPLDVQGSSLNGEPIHRTVQIVVEKKLICDVLGWLIYQTHLTYVGYQGVVTLGAENSPKFKEAERVALDHNPAPIHHSP
jgi:hypothetical protein